MDQLFAETAAVQPRAQPGVVNNFYLSGEPQKPPAGAGEAKAADSSTWLSQRQFLFPHITDKAVNDLHIKLNVAVTVVTDSNGTAAGLFGSISGNGSNAIDLSDLPPDVPDPFVPLNVSPILRVRTTSTERIKIVEWWWTHDGDKSDVGSVDKDGKPTK